MFKVLLEVRSVSGGGTGDWKRTRVGVELREQVCIPYPYSGPTLVRSIHLPLCVKKSCAVTALTQPPFSLFNLLQPQFPLPEWDLANILQASR